MTTVYITLDEVKEQFGDKDLPPKGTQPDDVMVQKCIDRAANYIDGILNSAGIQMPISDATIDELKSSAFSITRYYYKQRFASIPDFVVNDKDEALSFLSDVKLNIYKLKTAQRTSGLRTIDIILD